MKGLVAVEVDSSQMIGQWRDADGFGEPFRNKLIEDRAPRC
jgi:hypothetical protein